MLLWIVASPFFAQTEIDICDPESFHGLNYNDTLIAIDEFIMSTPEGEAFTNNRSWWNFVRNARQKKQLSIEVLGMPCDSTGNTPLHLAITKAVRDANSIFTTTEIIDMSDMSSVIYDSRTIISEGVNLSLFIALLSKNAPLRTVNEDGETPIDMVKRMVGAENLSNDKLDFYTFIYREGGNRNLTEQMRTENIFQRLCRSTEPRQTLLSDSIRRTRLVQGAITEYSNWLLTGAFSSLIRGELHILMDMYQKIRAEENSRQLPTFTFYSSQELQELRDQLEKDSIRCSGKSRYAF